MAEATQKGGSIRPSGIQSSSMSRGVLAASNVGQEVATTLTSSRAAFVLSSAKGEYVTQITIITDRVATVDGLADPVRASFLVDPADLNGRSVGS